MMLLSPLLSMPFILYGMSLGIRKAYTYFAIFLGIVAYLTAPRADLFHHARQYYYYIGKSWDYLWDRTISADFVIPVTEWYMANHNIPFEFLRLVMIPVSFIILNKIFFTLVDESEKEYSNREINFWYSAFFLSYPFYFLIAGTRYCFAACFMLYGMFQLIKYGNYVRALLFFCIAVCIHFSMMLFIAVGIIFIYAQFNKYWVGLFCIMAVVLRQQYVSVFGAFLMENELRGVSYIGEGIWASGAKLSMKAVLYYVGQSLCTLLPLVYVLIKRFDGYNKWNYLIVSLFFLILLNLGQFSLYVRTLLILSTVFIFYLITIEEKKALSISFKRIVMAGAVIIFAFNIYTNRVMISLSKYDEICYPLPFILIHHFDEYWIFQINKK